MITISLQYDDQNQLCGFTTTGHADYSEAGSDIVCAGVSAITQTCLLGLLHYHEDRTVYEVKNGFLSVHVEKVDRIADVFLETMVMGLEEIARQYGSYVVLKR